MENETLILDAQCTNLIEEIQQHFEVQFTPWEERFCAFQVKERENGLEGKPTMGLVYYYENCGNAKIAHELLHAKYEYLFDNEKYLLVDEREVSEATSKLLNYEFWEDFGNQVQHYIMFPEYERMGYDANEFFEGVNLSAGKLKRFIESGLKIGNTYDISRVKDYLNILLHLRFFPIDDRFRKHLPRLEKMDKSLYRIYQQLFEAIKGIDLDIQYYDKLHEAEWAFKQTLCKWIDNRSNRIPISELIADNEKN